MRLKKSMKNIKIAMIYQIVLLLITFIDRKVFLQILGVDYLGLNGLFTNIITMLSLAELGIGTAIVYNLYEPLKRDDQEEVAALMQLYEKAYYMIGIGIAFIGFFVAFLLPILIKEPIYDMNYVLKVYLVFLAGTILTYFTGHKRSLLYADQKNYLLLVGDISANTMGIITKLWVLFVYKNYLAYVVIHMTFKLVPNIWASYKVNQIYPYIKDKASKLSAQKLKQVKDNVKDLFIHKISNFAVNSTDNIIISSFIGLEAVGFVANYHIIIAALIGFITQLIDGIQASLGNLVASESRQKVNDIFDKLTFGSFWISSFCAVCLVCLVQPFIFLWLGQTYLLNNNVVHIIIINFFIWTLTRPTWQMMTVAGLFKEDKINALVEIVVNLVFSLVLVQKMGLIGVFIGTMISYSVAWIMKSHLLYRSFFKKSSATYYGKILIYSLIAVFEVLLAYKICKKINVSNTYLRFGIQMIICAILPNLINYILFSKTKNFKYFEKLIKGVMMNVIKSLQTDKMVQKIQKILFALVVILIFALPIDAMQIPMGTTIGKLAAVLIFLLTGLYIAYIMLVPNVIGEKDKKVLGIYFLGAGLLGIYAVVSQGMAGLKPTLMMILILNTGIAFAYTDYSKIGKWLYLIDLGVLSYLIIIINHYSKLETKPSSYAFIFTNPNYLGILSVLMIFICFLAYGISSSKRYFAYPLVFIWLMKLSRSRTAMLALLGAGVVYILWLVIRKYKAVSYSFLALIIGGIMIVTLLYPMANSLPSFEKINTSIIDKTGKTFFSGRERIWIESVDLIKEKPIMGYGMGASLQKLTEGDLNTHNEYLQLLLQGGLILLSLFAWLVIWMWGKLHEIASSKAARVGASALLGMLIIGTFELTLLGESMSLGIIQWFILGLALSPALYKNDATKDIKEME